MLDTDALEQRVGEAMSTRLVPGLSLAVVSREEVPYAKGFGVTSVEAGGSPVTPDTLFRLASVTKVLTGTALMRLVDTGDLDLDRPITAYLPWFRLRRPGAAERVTLRMLINHTSGLPEGPVPNDPGEIVGRRDPEGLEAHVREDITRYPLIAPPGTVYSYSNLGVNVAGYVAERVTGERFADLLQELVLDPLEMKRTTLDPTVAMTFSLSQSHQRNYEGTVRARHDGGDNTAYYPSAMAFSAATDVAKMLMLYMNGGEYQDRRLLSPESVKAMHTPRADLRLGRNLHYG